jgi:hypothetical protein
MQALSHFSTNVTVLYVQKSSVCMQPFEKSRAGCYFMAALEDMRLSGAAATHAYYEFMVNHA